MTNKKTTKRALLSSLLSLVLCLSMLIGTTFAWFTDSVTSANNIIKSGSLDVEMQWADGKTDPLANEAGQWKNAADGAIFDYDKWEPGYTEVRHIKISNVGTLALKYMLNIIAHGEVSKLADVIDVYFIDPAEQIAERTDLAGRTPESNLTDAIAHISTTGTGELEAGQSVVVTIALKMQESAGNEYQNLAIGSDFAVQLLATQLTYEEDSFDDQYDADAEYAVVVFNEADLVNALKVGGAVTLGQDISLTSTLQIPAGTTAVLNMNGHKLTYNNHKSEGAAVKNLGDLTIVGGTISSTAENGGSAIQNNGTLTVNGTTLNGATNANGSWPSYAVNNTGVMTLNNAKVTSVHGAVSSYGAGAVITLNNTDIDMSGIPGFTSHGIYTYNGGAAVVNGGNIENKAADQNATGGSVINGAVTVNGGTITGRVEAYYGTPVIKGGTFSNNPTKYVANGYEVETVDGFYVVVVDNTVQVATPDELVAAVTAGNNILLTESVSIPAGSGGYGIAGLKPATGSVFDGNGESLDVSGANGTWDCGVYTSGGTIKNLTVGGAFRGIFTAGCAADVIIDNCVIDNVCYTIHSDGSNPNYSIIVTNTTLNGWTSYTRGYKSVSFTNCKFGQGTGAYQYAYCRPYSETTFTDCVFEEGFGFDATRTTSTFVNCYVGDTLITQDNIVSLLGTSAANVIVK